jgi:hypothetical protein
MKSYITRLLLLFSAAAALPACRETSKLPEPAYENLPLVVPKPSTDTAKAYLNYQRSRVSDNTLQTSSSITNRTRPVFEFTFDLNNNRDRKVKTVEVYKTFERVTSRDYPRGNRVLVGSYSSFPATVTQGSQELLTGLYRAIPNSPSPYVLALKGKDSATLNGVFKGDAIVFTFEYILEDGTRIILTPVTSLKIGNNPGPPIVPAPFPSMEVLTGSTQINFPYAIRAEFRDKF